MNNYRYLFGQEIHAKCCCCLGAMWWLLRGYERYVDFTVNGCDLCGPVRSLYPNRWYLR